MTKALSCFVVILMLFLVSCSQGTPKEALAIENENLEEIVAAEDESLVVQAVNPIDPLVEKVEGLDIHKGIKRALLSKLNNAKEDFENGRVANTIRKLGAFINQVEAQAGKKITDPDAECLIEMAEAIMKKLPIEVVKTATPTEVVEPGGNVEFGVTVSNESSYDSAIIESLVDDIHGNLDKGTLEAHNWTTSSCDLPQTIEPNGSYSCTFTAYVAGNASDSETDTVTATGKDQQGNGWRNKRRGDDDDDDYEDDDDDNYVRKSNEFEDSGQATVAVTDADPEIEVVLKIKNAEGEEVDEVEVESGEEVELVVRITNNSVATDPVTITSLELEDDLLGDLSELCGLPTITSGDTYSCSFTASVEGKIKGPKTNEGSKTYNVTATGKDDEGNEVEDSDSSEVKIIVINEAPTITSVAEVEAEERQTTVVDVDSTDDNDSEGAGLIYSKTGGVDQDLFTLDADTGELTFTEAPDFENPGDDGEDNIYNIQVTVEDSGGLTDVQDIEVSVIDVFENSDWTPEEQEFDGATMVKVPEGSFTMGYNSAEQTFTQPFWIDKTEVTVGVYKKCVDVEGCNPSPYNNNFLFNHTKYPMLSLSWHRAKEYCEWRGARLPTEEEWEYAARGPSELIYPWGNNNPDDGPNPSDLLNYNEQLGYANLVGSYPAGASWVGALDMSGNALEWTSTIHESGSNLRAQLRGGWFNDDSFNVRATTRVDYGTEWEIDFAGFRCARS